MPPSTPFLTVALALLALIPATTTVVAIGDGSCSGTDLDYALWDPVIRPLAWPTRLMFREGGPLSPLPVLGAVATWGLGAAVSCLAAGWAAQGSRVAVGLAAVGQALCVAGLRASLLWGAFHA